MTKWKRLRKLREKKRFEAEVLRPKDEVTAELTEPEQTERTSLGDPRKIKKSEPTRTFKSNPILSQIPRYAYLLAIFVLLAGVFFPLITPGASAAFDHVIQGTAILFLGLAGGILLFKATTSDNRRGILITIGFALITICLVLIYHTQNTFTSAFLP